MKKILLISLILLLGGSLILSACSNAPAGPGKYDKLAQCMTAAGAVMYGTDWCPHCQNQKKLFGNSFQYINFVNCDNNKAACDAAGVQGYPTWVINGTSYAGEQNIFDLSKNSGCTIDTGA